VQVSAPRLLWVALVQSSAQVAQPAGLEQQLPALVLTDCADRLRDATAQVLTERRGNGCLVVVLELEREPPRERTVASRRARSADLIG
jgi:hypothetical protein